MGSRGFEVVAIHDGQRLLNNTWKASMIPAMFSGGSVKVVSWYDTTIAAYKTYIVGAASSDFMLKPGQGILGMVYWRRSVHVRVFLPRTDLT